MRSFWQDLRYAARTLSNAPFFTLTAIVTLALGMAVNTATFSVVNGLLLRPMPVAQPDQIVVFGLRQAGVQQSGDNSVQTNFSFPDYQDIRSQASAFSDVLAYRVSLVGLSADGKGDHCIVSRVTGNYFSMLGLKPALGRLILPSEGQAPGADAVLVLGYNYWQRRFGGDKNVVGKQVEANGKPLTIVGVAPNGFRGTYAFLNMDGYVPLSATTGLSGEESSQELWTHREERSLNLVGRLKPGVAMKQAQADVNVVAQRIAEQHADVDKGLQLSLYPEMLARPEPDPDNTIPKISGAFAVLAALVLFVACFNIANVLLVRATVRQREMAIRAAIGAGRARLMRQHLTESLLLAALGGGAGLMLGSWAASLLSHIPLGTDLPITFDFEPDARVYFFTCIAVVLTSVIVGIVPALRVARTDVITMLREGGRGASDGRRRHIARNSLVVAQLSGSLLLLIVAGLFIRSLGKAEKMYLGFNPDHVLDVSMDVGEIGYKDAQAKEFYRGVEERLKALPGVTEVTQAFTVPLGLVSSANYVIPTDHPLESGIAPPQVMENMVEPNYFETLQIPLKRGRTFTAADNENAPHVVIINETMAKKFWPREDALGKHFRGKAENQWKEYEVVGIVQDGKYKGVVEDPMPFMYEPLAQSFAPLRTIHVRTSMAAESLEPQIAAVIRQMAPGLPITVKTMVQELQGINGYLFFHIGAQLSGIMGLLGLILAIVGVYSVVSYAAAQRTHEIGIRMALGAEQQDILRMVLRQNIWIVAVGIALGLGLAFAGTRALATFLVGVSPSDPLTFGVVAALLSGVALLACWVPARRATRVSPLVALRYE